MGFHVFYHSHDAPMWHYEEVFAKRWRELNPSFARITDFPGWDPEKIDDVARYLEVMKDSHPDYIKPEKLKTIMRELLE